MFDFLVWGLISGSFVGWKDDRVELEQLSYRIASLDAALAVAPVIRSALAS